MAFIPDADDPFYEFMQPPAHETTAQKTARQKRELEAQLHSDSIDNDILESLREKKRKNLTKVLLLGQAGSGKSTMINSLRMKYARAEWDKERDSWRSVVQLNVVTSIITIRKVIEAEMNGDLEDDFNGVGPLKFTDRHRVLITRLAPLFGVEAELKCRLDTGTDPIPPSSPMSNNQFGPKPEFRSWQDVRQAESSSNTLNTVSSVLAECKDDMKSLWWDEVVRMALERRQFQLLDSAEFFLNDLDRIASCDYSVTDDDISHVRLRTTGIQEYRLVFDNGLWGNPEVDTRWEWRIFDVGGCQTARRAWLPYFDSVNVIIFLSSLSVFDQCLEEDSNVNRLEDSIHLWKFICSSKLLAKIQLVLFLNKCGLLRCKLKQGIKVNQFLPSFGERPNEVVSVVKYFREIFKDIQKQHSPEPRTVYIYPTTEMDTKAIAMTLQSVREGMLRENLAASRLV